MAGDPEAVDLQSLNRSGPVRLEVAVRDPSLIKGETEVFFNKGGRRLLWMVEILGQSESLDKTSSYSKFDRHRDKDNEEEEEDYRQYEEEYGSEAQGDAKTK